MTSIGRCRDAYIEAGRSLASRRNPPAERIGFYQVHPFLAVFPWVDDDAFAGIVDSIRRFGLIVPIMLTHDRRTLLDGRIRYRACEAAGVEPRFETLPERYTEAMILDYIVSVNLIRGHVSLDQRAALLAGIS